MTPSTGASCQLLTGLQLLRKWADGFPRSHCRMPIVAVLGVRGVAAIASGSGPTSAVAVSVGP